MVTEGDRVEDAPLTPSLETGLLTGHIGVGEKLSLAKRETTFRSGVWQLVQSHAVPSLPRGYQPKTCLQLK